jgi:hypothetical protein
MMPQDIGRVRIRLPQNIKANDLVRARVLIIHPMEIVERIDGKMVTRAYRFIKRVTVAYLNNDIAEFETTQSVSENPFFWFAFRATRSGTLNITFYDTHGGKFQGSEEVVVSPA